MTETLRTFIHDLAQRFDAEGRPGGDHAAAALRAADLNIALPGPEDEGSAAMMDQIDALIADAPEAAAVRPLVRALPWHLSGQADGRIRAEISNHMATAEIMGPDGPVHAPDCRVGLFFQTAGLDYPIRVHAAEETFLMLAGEGRWMVGDAPARLARPGDAVHHPSMAPHASVTDDRPLLAAWRWTGDIRYTAYTLVG